jgi:polysaccharide biosynthesis protein PslH
VFSGTLDFRPNVDALTWFAREVLPRVQARRPDAHLVVVGKRPAPALRQLARGGAVTIVGEVPDTRPYIAGAVVYIVPMRIGGGVRLKLLEALALEAPVVSTGMGAEGVAGLCGGEHCLLADDPAAFAEAVLRLLADRALGRRLGAAGRALVQERYDWSTIVPGLEAIYQELIAA